MTYNITFLQVIKLVLEFTVDIESDGKTVMHVLKNRLELSSRLIKKLKYSGRIFCNSIPVYVTAIVKHGEVVSALLDIPEENENITPENIPLDIIYEDECIIALNKNADIVVHPTSTHLTGTVANALAFYYLNKGIKKKIRPVSRLDRDTTGIIIFAKNEFVQEHLIQQMKNKTFLKKYIGIVNGTMKNLQGTIDLPIERKPESIMLRQVSVSGVPSITHYKVIRYLKNATYLCFSLETGRTHQIRVHCKEIGYPLIGDSLYSGNKTDLITRQALHSYMVSFQHPISKQNIELTSPIPSDIANLLEILEK